MPPHQKTNFNITAPIETSLMFFLYILLVEIYLLSLPSDQQEISDQKTN